MRVIVTGGRRRTDWQRVWGVLSGLLEEFGPFTLVHGACSVGVDFYAHTWALTHPECLEIQVKAKWRRPDGSIDRAAGPARNAEMVKRGADLVIAFPHPEGSGTQGLMNLARKAGILVLEHPVEG